MSEMRRALVRAITESSGAVIAGALESPNSPLLGEDSGVLAGLPANGVKLSSDLWELSAHADGILDFTAPAATIANVAIAAQRGIVHVIGTTGLSASDDAVIRSVTNQAVVVKSGNMSLGVNLLAAMVKRVAQALDDSFDIEIVEMHHKAKVDAPSGTALLLGEAAAAGCQPARRHRHRRSHRDLRRPAGTHRTDPQGRGSHDLRQWRAQGGAVGAWPLAGAVFDGRCARPRRRFILNSSTLSTRIADYE